MIALACDHAALGLKQKIIELLTKMGLKYKDFGCYSDQSVDYPDFAANAARSVACGECDRGIIMCGTGIGMAITANKIRGIRCALCCDKLSARATREHNDANMLALGARVMDDKKSLEIAECFLSTAFSGDERHVRRIKKIMQIENEI